MMILKAMAQISLYIDEDVNMMGGERAAPLLAKQNDNKFCSNDGIISVSKERWEQAQRAEATHWMKLGIGSNDDRNYEHARNMGSYNSISGRHFGDAIEIGCGPFTNLRIISNHCKIDNVTLLDPLISQYLTHVGCSYKTGFLNGIPATTINNTAEDIGLDKRYDLVVMINVLEHCYDAGKTIENAISLCSNGGVFIFHDKLYDINVTKTESLTVFDAAHPLRAGHDFIEKQLGQFKQLYRKMSKLYIDVLDVHRDMIYFIGEK
jgi:SAM-dependent methyltransferase